MLGGVRVLDLAHQYSGAMAACLLADLGADVVTVEHPDGSPIRTMLPKKDGQSMWWKTIQRGKRAVTLKLSTEQGRKMLLEMARHFDVVVENFRPGTIERWGLGPSDLEAAGLNVVLLRISGFGQTGPSRGRPGFGTVAEAMSGFAYLNGFPDGPPVFPSTTLADGVAATFGALGILAAMVNRLRSPKSGVQVVDMALFEGLFRLIPTQVSGYDQLKYVPKRPGNFLGSHGVLRNLYETSDGRYVCVSAVGEIPIRRVLEAAGLDALVARVDDRVMHADADTVMAFLDDCNEGVEAWASARPYEEVIGGFAEAGAVFQTVYNVEDIVNDPHYQAREDLIRVPDRDLGSILMQGVVPKFPGAEHRVSFAGPSPGEHNAEVYRELLGLDAAELDRLRREGII